MFETKDYEIITADLYQKSYKPPRQYIHVQPFAVDRDLPDYNLDDEDAEFHEQKLKNFEVTELVFEEALLFRYAREDRDGQEGVRINANVARATHGKRADSEVLGSGDGSASFQRFSLAQTPLTHVSAATASGGARRCGTSHFTSACVAARLVVVGTVASSRNLA